MSHPLEKDFPVIPIIVYRGCLVQKVKGGYKMWDEVFPTPKEIDEAIDNAGQSISNSLTISNKGNIECINSEEK